MIDPQEQDMVPRVHAAVLYLDRLKKEIDSTAHNSPLATHAYMHGYAAGLDCAMRQIETNTGVRP